MTIADIQVSHTSDNTLFFEIPQENQDTRLDVFLAGSCPSDLSRARIQTLIKKGFVKINDGTSKASYKLKTGDRVRLTIPPPEPMRLKPEAIDFYIVYEDRSLIVLDKPAGIVVHPAPGHHKGTLVHGLLNHCRDLSGVGGVMRPGIVHRLDKDTSGLLVVAKNDSVHSILSEQFKTGTVFKQYVALVHGRVKEEEREIDLPLSRHPKKRKQMAVVASGGRRALTRWVKIKGYQSDFTFLSIFIKTGRTHQIRVHLSHLGYPVVGDPVYGNGKLRWQRHRLYKQGLLPEIHRQMLHAKRLEFAHPVTKEHLKFEAPLPEDMEGPLFSLNWLDLQTKMNN